MLVYTSTCFACGRAIEAVSTDASEASWFEVGTCRSQCDRQPSAGPGGYEQHRPHPTHAIVRSEERNPEPVTLGDLIGHPTRGRARSEAAKHVFGA